MRWEPDNFSHDLRAANQEAALPWGCLDFRHNAVSLVMPSCVA